MSDYTTLSVLLRKDKIMKENNNAQLVYVTKEKDGKTYTNFYLRLGGGLVNVSIKVNSFDDKTLYKRLRRYCDETNGVKE